MPLQNRVDPFGALFANSSRGELMGNRGGRIHRDDKTLGTRRWASRQWICCQLRFKERHRDVWSAGYTELFFLDEATAFAAGHRPCFECRREDARRFAACWAEANGLDRPPPAPAMDRVLHAERLDGKSKRRHWLPLSELPDGAFVASGGPTVAGDGEGALLVQDESLLRWTPGGYTQRLARSETDSVEVLTPPAILAVLAAGYRPILHVSADAFTNSSTPS